MTFVSEWFANERKQEDESHSFCLPVWSVLPFSLHFLLGNQFLGEVLWLLKDVISCLVIYNWSGLCKQRIYVRTWRVIKLFVEHRVFIGTVKMPFFPL